MDLNAVITGDLVKSSRIKDEDIGAVLKSFKRSFNEVNNYLLSGEGLFEIYRGDSFQIVIKKPEKHYSFQFCLDHVYELFNRL